MHFQLKTLASRVGGRLDGPADLAITGVAGIRDAVPGDLTFVAQPRYLADLESTRASAVILREGIEIALPAVRVEDPYLAFLKAIELFARPASERFPEGIHPTAILDPTARLGEDVRVGPYAVVDKGVVVGARSILGAHAVLMEGVRVGEDCLLYPQVVVREDCALGNRVILHPGVVVGSDGFGFAKGEGIYHKIPQIGRVLVEDDVEIGANSCIDRATTGRTVIGAGTKLDNLVQIAHNVTVGRHCVLSSQVGVAGSTRLGDAVTVAGQVGIAGHIEIGDRVQIGAKSGISNNVGADAAVSGIPARDHREWRRSLVHIGRLPRYEREIAELRRRLAELERSSGASSTENA